MLQLGYNTCQKEQNIQLHGIYTMLRSQDKGQNNKRSLTFYKGVKFSSWLDFNENGLQLIGSSN